MCCTSLHLNDAKACDNSCQFHSMSNDHSYYFVEEWEVVMKTKSISITSSVTVVITLIVCFSILVREMRGWTKFLRNIPALVFYNLIFLSHRASNKPVCIFLQRLLEQFVKYWNKENQSVR